MANIDKTKIGYNEIASAGTANAWLIQHHRRYGAPMDISEVFTSFEAAQNYASTDIIAYAGQTIAVAGEGIKTEVYKITSGSTLVRLVDENDIKNLSGGTNNITVVTPDWNAQEGEDGYIANKPCFSLKTVNGILDNLNPYFNTDFENGAFYPKHDLYVEYENKIIFMCKKDTELYYGDGITIIDDNDNFFYLDGDYETGEIRCVGGGYDFELIFSLDKKYMGLQSTEDTTVTPDWSATEGKEGYILNRTHYKDVEIFENGGLKTNDDGEPISPHYIRFRNEYGNLSDLVIVNDYTDGSYIEGTPLYNEYGDTVEYIYGTLIFQPYNWTIEFTPEGDGIYYVDSVYESLKQLDEEFIPDTIARKSELTELSEEVSGLSERIDNLPTAGSSVSDWNALPGEEGYIKNKPSLTNFATKNEVPISLGSVNNTAVLKGEYDGYSNKAISQTSMAVGAATTAGLKGWYYTHVNIDEKKIFLGTERTKIAGIDTLTCTYKMLIVDYSDSKYTDSSFVSGYEVGDVLSIVYDSKYEDYATITAISGNVITLDNIPFVADDFTAGVNTKVSAVGQPDEFSVYCIKRDFNDTLKTLTVTKHDNGSVDFGGGSLSEGVQTYALNIGAHAEGGQTMAKGQYSHAEGLRTQANYAAHAEGVYTEAIGINSHAEGNRAKSIGDDSHAEGDRTESHGAQSHAEGSSTIAVGESSHAEGMDTIAIGNASHAEGRYTVASQTGAHAEGRYSIANGYGAHAEGGQDSNTNAELKLTSVSGNDKQYTYSSGYPYMYNACYVELDGAHVIAQITAIDTTNKTITLDKTIGNLSDVTVRFAGYAGGVCSHSEGSWSVAVKNSAHAEGYATYANALASHAEGHTTTASGDGSHAEGRETKSTANYSHAEGRLSKALKSHSHAEGYDTTADGVTSHAEGEYTIASGQASHAEGFRTKTTNVAEHASGKYNKSTKSDDKAEATQFSIGIGTGDSDDKRKNAFEVKQNGDVYITGIGGFDGANYDKAKSVQDTIKELTATVKNLNEIIKQITITE